MARMVLQFLPVLLLMLIAMTEATPPGIAKNPSHARCTIKKYKMCYNLEHVYPKFCPDECTVNCVPCKPMCVGSSSPPPPEDSNPPPPKSPKPPTPATSTPPPSNPTYPPSTPSPKPPFPSPSPPSIRCLLHKYQHLLFQLCHPLHLHPFWLLHQRHLHLLVLLHHIHPLLPLLHLHLASLHHRRLILLPLYHHLLLALLHQLHLLLPETRGPSAKTRTIHIVTTWSMYVLALALVDARSIVSLANLSVVSSLFLPYIYKLFIFLRLPFF